MNKKILVIGLFSLSSVTMFSCKDEEPAIAPAPTEYTPPTAFSSKTSEENKAQLETNGIDLVNDLSILKNTSGIEALANLSSLFGSSGDEGMRKSSGGNLLESIRNFRLGHGSSEDVFNSMRLSEHGAQSLQEVFDENAGTHTWNASINDFDFVSGSGAIVYKFPSTETGSTNNAALTFKDYKGVVIATPIDDYTGDVPTNLLIELTVDGSKVMDYTFSATYSSTGEPTSVNSKLTVAPFALSVTINNTTDVAGFEYTFSKDGKTLISMGISAKGKFNDTANTQNPSDVITEGTVHFQFLNIKVSGTVDVVALEKELNENTTDSEDEIINRHTHLVVYYADSNEKIADTEYYTFTETTTITYYWDSNGDGIDEPFTETYEDEYGDLRFIFSDGSKVDSETYFESGFDAFKTKIDELIEG